MRAELELCDRWGIPHSQWLGGTGAWTPQDRAKALAWHEWQRTVCQSCGTRADEWDEKAGGDRDAYIPTSLRCHGCESIEQAREHIPEGPDGYGVKLALIPYEAWEQQQIVREKEAAARTARKAARRAKAKQPQQ